MKDSNLSVATPVMVPIERPPSNVRIPTDNAKEDMSAVMDTS